MRGFVVFSIPYFIYAPLIFFGVDSDFSLLHMLLWTLFSFLYINTSFMGQLVLTT